MEGELPLFKKTSLSPALSKKKYFKANKFRTLDEKMSLDLICVVEWSRGLNPRVEGECMLM